MGEAAEFDLVVRGGRLAGPAGLFAADLAVAGGRVAGVLEPGRGRAGTELDARGLVVLPGLIDLHAHLRDPGQTWKEDTASGTAAAAAGGFTTVVAQPNTDPPLTEPAALAAAQAIAVASALVDVGFSALVTRDNWTRLDELRLAGAWCLDLVDTDLDLAAAALACGLPAAFYVWAPQSEAAGAARIAALARGMGTRAILRQISSGATIEALAGPLRQAVWLEVNPHHLALGPEAGVRVLPPLVGALDRAALWRRFDYVATDHAPHAADERAAGASGLPGLETALSVLLDLGAGWDEVVCWLARRPARILGRFPRKGSLRPGADADFVLVDPSASWVVDESRLFTRARFSPFAGRRLPGRVVATHVRGRCVYREGTIVGAGGAGA